MIMTIFITTAYTKGIENAIDTQNIHKCKSKSTRFNEIIKHNKAHRRRQADQIQYIYTVFHKKNNHFDYLLYLCQVFTDLKKFFC